ncbi:rho guanine nucleotide exchange factor 2-like, partial [Protobothrops mucrosquamatus]|uniref:rho guanine nucleotide exchange factor 2-like n=1 Tax=Protobothrops mucrosquamatus TaxID=103944 RepID=UPI0010FB4C37
RLSRSSVLRRHGVQECILLVTQRITKYPGLIDRILQNSKGNEVDQKDLRTALTLVKELLSTIDQEVHNQEKNARLQEIYGRVDGRTKAHLPWERGPFSKEEMLRRKLVHDGCMLWKTPAGRFKDVLVVLMTDVLIFLQEKDQKYIFPTLRLSRSSVLRRHGVQECILLVTQRITKYPGLIDRILQNSKGNEVDQKDLRTALTLVKELLSTIDQEVHNQEKNARLQEIYGRVDGRTKAHLPWERGPFSKEEMLRRKLVHDGCMLWKTPAGRFKDVLVVLMTDVLIFLQEKDQKYIFPTLDKPTVISIQNLIVRDIANQEKGMFLISGTPPEMYEVHAASRDDRNTWMKVIQQSVKLCPHRDDFPLIETESEASLRKLKDKIQQCDQEIGVLLREKAELFADLVALQSGREDGPLPWGNPRSLFRTESSDPPHGEKLVQEAIREVEVLKDLVVGPSWDLEQNHTQTPSSCSSPNPSNTANGETGSTNDALEFARVEADSNHRDGNGNQLQPKGVQEEMLQRLKSLYSLLHGLQVRPSHRVVLREDRKVRGLRHLAVALALSRSNSCKEAPPADQQSTELALLQKQHALLQQELSRCRQLGQEKAQEVAVLEARLRESEGERQRLEREADEARRQLAAPRVPLEAVWVRKGAEPRRRSLPAGDALYQSFTPPPQNRGGEPLSPGCHSLHRTFSSGQREEASFPGVPGRLQEEAEEHLQVLMEEEGLGNSRSPPSSPRDFQRMQDIPEEVESIQESNAGDGDLLGS